MHPRVTADVPRRPTDRASWPRITHAHQQCADKQDADQSQSEFPPSTRLLKMAHCAEGAYIAIA